MENDGLERDKPWRPADHPRPAPSWDQAIDEGRRQPEREHVGVPNAED